MRLLWVDDDPEPLKLWFAEIERAGHDLLFVYGVDDAIHIINQDISSIDRIIIDVMLPTQKTYRDKDTGYGMKTGLLLAHDIQKIKPDFPILLLTNKGEDVVRQEMPSDIKVQILVKPRSTPSEVVAWIDNPDRKTLSEKGSP